MNPYLPHTEADIREMLSALGLTCLEELFQDIPPGLRLERPLDLPPPGLSERETFCRLRGLAKANKEPKVHLGG